MGWFVAYVWPAVALDRYEKLLNTFVAELSVPGPLPAVLKAVGTPLGLSGEAEASNPSSPRGHLEMRKRSPGPSSFRATLAEGANTLLYAAVAALLALLAFAVWAELGAAVRSRRATDRWHQGL